MPLKFEIGQSSLTGPRERNEDYVGIVTPENAQLSTKGALIAVADGVSGNAGGGEASEMTVRTVSADYYATPDTWQPPAALDKVIAAANRWLISQASANRDLAGMATTLSLLILRGQRYYSAHVGDTRIYLLRDGALKQLTADHVWDRPDMRHVLKRAVGLDAHLAIDFAEGALQVGDVFALMSDGAWESLGEKAIHEGLSKFDSVQMVADHLTKTALDKESTDNSTAIIIKITELGADTLSERIAGARHLGLPPKMNIGELIDDFEVLEILHESRASLLYKVRQTHTNQIFVLKTLQALLANDLESCNGLLNEEWLGKRVVSQYVPQVLPLSMEKRSDELARGLHIAKTLR
jgi:serine/threonine protein phosphatase PrpC